MFNNYAIVQGVDHIVPVDIYLPGCPPRPEMLLNAILDAARAGAQRAPRGEPRGGRPRRGGGGHGRNAHLPDEGVAAVSDEREAWPGTRPTRRRPRQLAGAEPPATPGAHADEVVDVRHGMFGADGTGDTSGYGGLVRTVAMPGPSERPYGGWFDEVVDILAEVLAEAGVAFDDAVEGVVVDRGELTLNVRREHVVAVCQALRDDPDLRFELGLGVSGVHFPGDVGRELHAAYHLCSVTHSRRLRLEVTAPDADPHIPSTVGVYPGARLARAGDLRLLRHHLRRAPGAGPDRDARRLAGAPPAQGLPARRDPGRVQGRADPAARPAEGLQLMSRRRPRTRARPSRSRAAPPSSSATGGDWSTIAEEAARLGEERIVVNMGPQHPSTHGVLRLMLEIDGETVTEARCGVGYLHTGIEKNMEFRNWTQGVTFCTRMDYLAPFFQEAGLLPRRREAARRHR